MARHIQNSAQELQDQVPKRHRKTSQLFKAAVSLTLCLALFVGLISPQIVWAASDALAKDVKSSQSEPYERSILFEDTSLREQAQKTFRMSDGSFKTVVYPEAIHYKDNNEWQDIDNTLVLDENAGGYTNLANDFTVTFAKKSDSKKLVEIKTHDYKLSWGFIDSSNNKTAQKKTKVSSQDSLALQNLSDGICYNNIFADVDVEYILTSNTLKENIILNNQKSKNTFELELKLIKATAVLNSDRSISIVLEDGKVAATIAAPYMFDANGDISTEIDVVLSKSGNKYILTLTPSESWLSDESRTYPVTIDPVITPTPSTQTISSVNMQSEVARTGLYAGAFYNGTLNTSDLAYGFIGLTMPINPSEHIVQNVTVKLDSAPRGSTMWNGSVYNNTTINKTIGIHSVSAPFYTSSQEANVDIGEVIDAALVSLDYSSDISKTYSFDITEFFYGNYDHTEINYLMLMEFDAPDTVSAGTLPVCFTNFRLEYDYRSPKGVEEYLTYTEASIGNSGTIYLADATGNLVYARHLLTTHGEVSPITVGMIYENGTWHTNFNQTLTKFLSNGTSSAYEQELYEHGYPYMWVDGDGTEIYFHKTYEQDENGNETTVLKAIEDETGKRLTLKELSNGNVTITDTNGVVNTFEAYSGNKYRLCKITNEFLSETKIEYESSSSTDISRIYNNDSGEIVSYDYTDGKLDYVSSENAYFGYTQSVSITYDVNGNLHKITDNDTNETVYGYTNGKLDRVLDSKSGYMVKISTNGNKKTLQEYAGIGEDMYTAYMPAGQSIEITYNGTHTTFRTPGVDGVVSNAQNSDDILTVYQFDNYLRTVSAYSKSYVGNTFYGAEQQEYTSGGLVFNSNTGKAENSSEKFGFNKIKNTVATGDSTKNMLSNGSFEQTLPANNTSPLNFCGSIFDCNDPIPAGSGATLSDYLTTEIVSASESVPVLSGNKALKVSLNAQGDALRDAWYAPIAKTASLAPNTEYTFSAYVRSDNLNAQNIRLAAKIGTAEYLSDKAITITVSEEWRRVELRFTTPESLTGEVLLCLKIEAAGSVFVDCAQLEKGAAANAVNHADNAGFENTDTASASIWQRNNLTASDGIVSGTKFGEKAFKIVGSPSASKSVTQYLPITNASDNSESRTFTISAFAKANALPENEEIEGRFFGIRAQFVYYDSETDENVYSDAVKSSFNARQKDWQFASLSATSEEGKELIGVNVTLAFDGQCGTCLFDNVSIEDNTVTNYEYDSLGNVVRVEVTGESETINTYDETKLETSTTKDVKDNESDEDDEPDSSTLNQYLYGTSVVSHTVDADVTYGLGDDGETDYDNIVSVNKINSVSYTAHDYLGRVMYTQTGTNLMAGYTFYAMSGSDISQYNNNATLHEVVTRDDPEYDLWQAAYMQGDGYIEIPNFDTGDYFTIVFKGCAFDSGTVLSKYESDGEELFSIYATPDTCILEYWGHTYEFPYTGFDNCSNYVAFTFERINEVRTRITSYCDGYLDESYEVDWYVDLDEYQTPWYFGTAMDEDGNAVSGFEGYLDDIAFFRGALSKYEIMKINADGLQSFLDNTEDGEWTYYDYGEDDVFLYSETDSDGNTTDYDYTDCQLTSVTTTDRDGVSTRINYEYNLDKTLKKVYHDSNKNYTYNSGEKYNEYTYDDYGNLQFVEHNGMTYEFAYNEFGQLFDVCVDGSPIVWYEYAYNDDGYINGPLEYQAFEIGGNILEQSFVYDKLGNVVGKKNNGTYIQKWAYDKLGNLVFENDLEDGTQTSYQYDAQSRLTQRKANLVDGYSFTSQFLYNSDSNITEAAYNFNKNSLNITFSDLYSYEDGKFILSDSGNTRTQTAYDDKDDSVTSRSASVKKADGSYTTVATETYSYYEENSTGKIKDAVSEIDFGNNEKLTYEYYANGNIKAEYRNGQLYKTYKYDELGQLTESCLYDIDVINEMVDLYGGSYATEGEHYKFKYTYDSGNNMTSYAAVYCSGDDEMDAAFSQTMTYGGTYWADQISSVGNRQYSYDAVGNLTSDGILKYTWENGRELSSIKYKSSNSVIAEFEYDSSGLRISKELNYEGGIRYAYDENSNLIFERHNEYVLAFHYDGNGIRTHFDYISGSSVTTYYYRYNLQGDVIALVDSTGEVVAEYEYDPYGRLINMPSEIGEINPFTYRGYYYDWGLDLYYLQSRYYNPNTCRFLNADDTAFLGATGTLLSYNLYTYCENDPINYIDKTGHEGVSIAAVGCIIFVAVIVIVGLYNTVTSPSFVNGLYDMYKAFSNCISSISKTIRGVFIKAYAWIIAQSIEITEAIIKSIAKLKKIPKYKSSSEKHHIVAKKAAKAERARNILNDVGIGYEHPRNLIYLKTVLHRRLHTNQYYNWANSMVVYAYDSASGNKSKQRKNVLQTLDAIRMFLVGLNNMIPR